jgi:hypothetical protein
MIHDTDLFGVRIPPPATYRKDGLLRRRGYAARPGTGPKGARCFSCKHCVKVQHDGIQSHKCELIADRWTYDAATDIKHNAPACRDWMRRQYPRER